MSRAVQRLGELILYNAVGGLEAQQYRQDCGAYFKSIEGTLNHLLVTDRIWRHRLCGLPDPGYRLTRSFSRTSRR